MKVKIIDLLNKIANDEEMPKIIRYKDNFYYRNQDNVNLHIYQTESSLERRKLSLIIDNEYLNLNDEVEIIEEDKKIEKIKSNGDEFYSDYIDTWISKNKTDAYCEFLGNKINELIDEVNKLKEDKE